MASSDSSDNEESSYATLTNIKLEGDDTQQKGFSTTKYYKQTYRKDWESMPDFKGWLSCVPGEPTRAYCKFCEKTLHAHRLSLLKHTCTLKHTRAAKNAFNNKQLSNSIVQTKQPENSTPVDGEKEKQDRSELAEHVQPKEEVVSSTPDGSPSLNSSASLNISIDAQESDIDEPMEMQQSNNTKDSGKAPAVPPATTRAPQPNSKAITTDVPQSQGTVQPQDGYISTHVLDTSKGRPLAGLMVSLYRLIDGRWTHIAESLTNPDGRCTDFVKKENFVAGRYKLHYDVDLYYERRRIDSLYPFIEIAFDVRSPQEHYHIPLLLSPFGYTTYRGS